MREFRTFLACTLLAVSARAADPGGTAGFQFLKTQVGARSAAMAGAMVAVTPDMSALHYNPAGVAAISQRGGSFSYLDHLLDFNAGYISYVEPRLGPGNLAAAITYMDYGEFSKRDQNNQELGTFGAGSIAISGGYGLEPLPNLQAGAAVNYVRATIDAYASDAVTVSAGLRYTIPSQRLTLGINLANYGQVLTSFIRDKDPLPQLVRVGLSKQLAHLPLMFGIQLYKYSDEEWHGALGGEFTLNDNLYLRLGYDQAGRDLKVDASGDSFAGASIGLGAIWRNFNIDYAYSSMGALGALNRFTLTGTL